MTDRPSPPPDHAVKAHEVAIDLEFAPPTRVADYVDGGDAHFSVDREVAEKLMAAVPGGVDGYRAVSQAAQTFLERVVHHLTAEAGIRQFLVAGSRLSGAPKAHELAQAIAPECRVVYLVLDPVMLAYAHTLRSTTPEGATAYIQAKLSQPDEIVRQAAATLDLSQPVGVLIPASLAFVRNADTAYGIVNGLMAGVASGSWLMLTHHASDIFVEEHAELCRTRQRLVAEGKTLAVVPRSHAELSWFFESLDLVAPGVVPIDEWPLPHPTQPTFRGAIYGALASKP